MASVTNVHQGTHYTVGQAGSLKELEEKLFVGKPLGFTGMEVSLNRFGPGQEVPFVHQHQQHEEMYLFLDGHGQFQVDGEIFDVQPGTIVRVLPGGKRVWRNNSDGDLICIVIQANIDTLTGHDGIRSDDPVKWPKPQ